MTATNVFLARDAVHLFTDGANYNDTGILVSVGPKVFTAPHLPLAVAACGARGASLDLGHMLAQRFQTFDELVGEVESIFPAFHAVYVDRYVAAGDGTREVAEMMALVLCGFSARRRRAEAYFLSTLDIPEDSDAVVPACSAFKLRQLGGVTAIPTPNVRLWQAGAMRAGEGEGRLRRNGIELMEAQRRTRYEIANGGTFCTIGGFVQMTTVTADAIRQQVVRRWPEDQVGRKVEPRRELAAA
jgi:hypothetical protein